MSTNLSVTTPLSFGTILVAVLIVDLVVLFLIRFFPDFFGKDIRPVGI